MRWIALLLLAAVSQIVWAQTASPTERAQRARDLVVSGKPEQAIPIYEELLRASPGNAALMANLVVAQFQAGRYGDAIAQSQKALAIEPDLLAARLFLGASYLKSGDPANAIEPLQRVVSAQPGDRNANLMLAEALSQAGRDDEAAPRFLTASGLLPEEPRVWYGMARACQKLSRDNFRKLRADSPYREALAGDADFELGRYATAIRHYQQALHASDAVRPIYQSILSIYRASGHADWATRIENRITKLPAPDCEKTPQACAYENAEYERLLNESAATPQSLYWRAKACNALSGGALAKLQDLPESVQLHELRASRLEDRGLYNEAAGHWQKALQLDPANHTLKTALASAFYRGGDFAKAIPLLQDLLRDDPDSAELNFLCGSSLLLSEQPQEALAYLKTAAETDSLRAQAALGQALLSMGSYEDAIPHLAAAAASDEDGHIYYQLARAYQAAKQRDEAAQALQQYRDKLQAYEAQKRAGENTTEIAPPD